MDDDAQFCAAISSAVAATLAAEQPPWLQAFEETADELARRGNPSTEALAEFKAGVLRCGRIIEALGFSNPAPDRVLIVAVLAAHGLAFARALREGRPPMRSAQAGSSSSFGRSRAGARRVSSRA